MHWSRLVHNYDAILLANHGVVTCGGDLLTAFFAWRPVEHFARFSLASELLGKQVLLSAVMWKIARGARAVRHDDRGSRQFQLPSDKRHRSTWAERISVTREQLEALIEEAVRKDRAHR